MTGRAGPVPYGLPAGSVSSTDTRLLADGWVLTSTEPGALDAPAGLAEVPDARWATGAVPGTVASCRGADLPLDGHPDYDAHDWWYRRSFADPREEPGSTVRLRFDGLATLAAVWLNGTPILESTNMFVAYEVDVSDLLAPENDLVVVFRSLGEALAERRPRPRWKTNLVDHQRLRWFRTTLLGRIPGWTPRIRPVGPWRSVWLEVVRGLDVRTLETRAGWEDGEARLSVSGTIASSGAPPRSAAVTIADREYPLTVRESSSGGWSLEGDVVVEGVEPWWPHTHGRPRLYDCVLTVRTADSTISVEAGRVGFRTVEVDRSDDRIRFVVNGVPVFCRGACWTTNDIVSLTGDAAGTRRTLELLARAHGNMVRVGGTMVYETEDFYRACDELGIMVWQDFMFANMDYPVEDESFAETIRVEARQQLIRLSRHASVVAWCGGSEVEQQAAMFGAPREIWSNAFFSEELPALVAEFAPGAAYWPSTPTGGVLPFHTSEGLTHYYGVGAYKRPLEDCRLAGVKFTPECLGFSNVPEPENLRGLGLDGTPPPHHPAWKAGVPRDTGAGWDFEDIRDHYVERIHGEHAVELRSHDPERYLRLARAVPGRLMARVFDEWRSPAHPCSGGLVWFLRDLRPGAGWGIVDSDNRPKSALFYLRRAWAPVRVTLLDRGLEGLRIEVHNETGAAVTGHLRVRVHAASGARQAESSEPVEVPPRESRAFSAEALLGHFLDPAYAYRFGPRRHAVVSASLLDGNEAVLSTSTYWPTLAEPLPRTRLEATLDSEAGELSIVSEAPARGVRIEMKDAEPADNYFDMPPGEAVSIALVEGAEAGGRIRGHVEAENDPDGSRL